MDLTSVNLDISERLKDREFRRNFFLAETSAKIAEQIIRPANAAG
jgi:hypothetical protein